MGKKGSQRLESDFSSVAAIFYDAILGIISFQFKTLEPLTFVTIRDNEHDSINSNV